MPKYPIFLDLEGRRAVVVGGGRIAYQKAQGLVAANARLVVLAPDIGADLAALCEAHQGELLCRDYHRRWLGPARVVIACTDDPPTNERVYRDCQEAGILCNVVDTPAFCDFFVPAIVRRDPLQIAIGTEGASPAFAKKVRERLEQQYDETHGAFLRTLQTLRAEVQQAVESLARRERLLSDFADDASFEFFLAHGASAWLAHYRGKISPNQSLS